MIDPKPPVYPKQKIATAKGGKGFVSWEEFVERKSRSITVNIWADKDGNRPVHIKMASSKEEFITTFTDDPESVRCHPHAFEKLKKLLIDEGKWPFD